GNLVLGDIFICQKRAREQAEEYGHSYERELCFLCLHGFLHLLGYDHIEATDEQQMFALQEQILADLQITRGNAE
ncbi:MAG: rRNA maturation RNase YbeY, partial [Clostridia bacterium]